MQTSNNDIDVRQMLKPTRSDIALVLAKAGLQELPGGGVVASLMDLGSSPIDRRRDEILIWMAEKLDRVDKQSIISPDPLIAGPALEDLRYAYDDPYLREMYTNLLSHAMYKETAGSVHRGFVSILQRMGRLDAQFLENFKVWQDASFHTVVDRSKWPVELEICFVTSGGKITASSEDGLPTTAVQADAFLENLVILGLIKADQVDGNFFAMPSDEAGQALVHSAMRRVTERGGTVSMNETICSLTATGKVFLAICSPIALK